ncbi:MAG: hypothetical protein JWP91_1728 [Fibrobacteres bacterium]|nr:hypothetical protein [Fibrobacterota bacterium]
MTVRKALLVIAFGTGLGAAHIGQGSLSIVGGEKYAVGQAVKVSFLQKERHTGKYDLNFSKDNGKTWTPVAANWTSPSGDGVTVTYNWTVPNAATAQGRFQVCQLAGSCTDPDYGIVSGAFTVAAASAVIPADNGAYFAPAMRFDAEAGGLDVSFGLEERARLTLYAYDTRGKLLATLLDEFQAAGYHHLSLFSNRLQGMQGHVIFQLRSGSAVLAEMRSQAR